MDSPKTLHIKPISWSPVKSRNLSIKASIQVFGYTSEGKSIYIRIPQNSTFVLLFPNDINEEIIAGINDLLQPSTIKQSEANSRVLIIRAPLLSPLELQDEVNNAMDIWTECKQDPHGVINSLFEARRIKPYEWLEIRDFIPIPGKYTHCEINIETNEFDLSPASSSFISLAKIITPKLFFWDIEVFSETKGQFPTSQTDPIFMISVITSSAQGINGYVIVTGNISNECKTCDRKGIRFRIIKAESEKTLIDEYLRIYRDFRPDREVYYNGDSFDMPYLLDRIRINGISIPPLGKIFSLYPSIIRREYQSSFGKEFSSTLLVPGTETIDLLHYYRRFYSGLSNYKLDTVAKAFLSVGKTDLSIEDMMEAVRTQNREEMDKVVEYSYIDSLRLKELWQATAVNSILETLCNNIGVVNDTLLRKSFSNIVDVIVYNIDPGTVFNIGYPRVDESNNLRPKKLKPKKGLFTNVVVYDYSQLYRDLLINSEQTLARQLGNILFGTPPQLISTLFNSKYIDKSVLMSKLEQSLNVVSSKAILVNDFHIITEEKLHQSWANAVGFYQGYVALGNSSFIFFDKEGMKANGLAKLCRPFCTLARDIIQDYLILGFEGKLSEFKLIPLTEYDLENFLITQKLDESSINADINSIKYKLVLQYDETIVTWAKVKYLMTIRGPILKEKLLKDDKLDLQFYADEIDGYLRELYKL